MNKFNNWTFVIAFPCWIWDIYNFFCNGDHSLLSCVALGCLTLSFAIEIPAHCYYLYKTGHFFYED